MQTAKSVNELLSANWENCTDKSYKSFTAQCMIAVKTFVPVRGKNISQEPQSITTARSVVLRASLADISNKQQNLKTAHTQEEETRINNILNQFDKAESTNSSKNAWKLVKELSGKKKPATCFISGNDRLQTWKDHFQKLLNNVTTDESEEFEPQPIFQVNENISTDNFNMEEIEKAIKQMKSNKTPGLDSLPLEIRKLDQCKEVLLSFCNSTLNGIQPTEWGLSAIVPVPKKGDLKKTDNYRGISLSQVSAKIYNRLILNRLRPKIEKVLRPNQNGFRSSRSTSSQILALRRIIEEIKNHKMKGIITFIDFRKAFDSIDRKRMFKILLPYGIT